MESLPDELIEYIMMNSMNLRDIENFKVVNKRINSLYKGLITTYRDEWINKHYDYRDKSYFMKYTNIRWGYSNELSTMPIEGVFINGIKEGIFKEYRKGYLYMKGRYQNGRKEGHWETYYPDGTISTSMEYVHNIIQGPYIFYYENGNIEMKGTYHKNNLSGYTEYYYRDGSLRSRGMFENSRRTGYWESFHEDGSLYESGSYHDGNKSGHWVIYTKLNTKLEGDYICDVKNGIWTVSMNGIILLREPYKNGIVTWNSNI